MVTSKVSKSSMRVPILGGGGRGGDSVSRIEGIHGFLPCAETPQKISWFGMLHGYID